MCTVSNQTCCAFWMLDLLEFTGWYLTTRNYKWVMTYGTLLGAYRNQTILPCECVGAGAPAPD